MIILFEENERSFVTNGLGSLRDAISCYVEEGLNDSFELEMEYPINGIHYSDITLKRIIYCKPNMFDNPQPFRIYEITKPINGRVTIKAAHISYDMSNYVIKPFKGQGINDTLLKIQNGSVLPSPFTFSTDIEDDSTIEMETKCPYNMRSLLGGSGNSLLEIYEGEFKFDKFHTTLLEKRGTDRGFKIKYSKNMTDLEQVTDSNKLYTGVLFIRNHLPLQRHKML